MVALSLIVLNQKNTITVVNSQKGYTNARSYCIPQTGVKRWFLKISNIQK